jgi:hypothetical protein
MHSFALLLLFACQDPAAGGSPPASPAPLDLVELRNGDTLEGRITVEVDGYVELQLDAGATVGFSMAEVARIRRAAGGAAPVTVGDLPAHGEWFVLHDAAGAAVGWLSTSVTANQDGGFTIGEEYEFTAGRKRYQVTSMATASADRRARSCYFRERISEPVLATLSSGLLDGSSQDRTVDERIVEAQVVGRILQIQHLDRTGRRERELAWPEAASFPLLARTLARSASRPLGDTPVFDPAGEELVVRSYDGTRRRKVVHDGVTTTVQEVAEASTSGRNSEWLDGTFHTLRRELAGPSLVALPSAADSARLAVGAVQIPAAIVPEPSGAFGLWIPNPAWTRREDLPEGQVALLCSLHDASVALSRLDHLEPGASLDTAAEAVANWFALLHPELRLGAAIPLPVRDRQAIQRVAEGRRGGVPFRATLDVIPQRERYLVLVCMAPVAAWDELAADFAFVRRSIELEAQSLAPRLQGPLAEKGKPTGRGAAVPPRPAAAPTPSPSPSPADGTGPNGSPSQPASGTVRIPD